LVFMKHEGGKIYKQSILRQTERLRWVVNYVTGECG